MLRLRLYKNCVEKYIVSWIKNHCYKSVGFQDVQLEETETYHVLGEDWKCRELEISKS